MRFLIVIPTIRQGLAGFEETMRRIRESLTQPTDLRVLDGREGKAQTLNRALEELLPASEAEVYVTMDDDYIPPHGWQDLLVKGFGSDPRWGALGLWIGDDERSRYYMLAHYCGPLRERGGLSYRNVPHNIVGCMIAFRREVALAVGATPSSDEKYQVWEDGYRCARVKKLGYRMAYLMGPPPTLVDYRDTADYQATKERDIQHAIPRITGYMRQGGVGPSLLSRAIGRLRRMLSKR